MWVEHQEGWKGEREPESDQKKRLLPLKARQSGVTLIDVWALSLIRWLNPSIYMQKRCLMQIGPIRQNKVVLSGSYGNKTMPTIIGKAKRTQRAGGDLMLWCSKLGDYMLAAPLRLVLLRWPNCSAILSFLRLAVKAWWQRMLHYTMQLPRPLCLQQYGEWGWGVGHLRNKTWSTAPRH